MQHTEFSTLTVEQAHGSLSTVLRSHKQMSQERLAMRSYAHSLRALFAKAPVDSIARSLAAKKEKMQKPQPQKVTGRHMFLSNVFVTLQEKLGRSLQAAEREHLFRTHSVRFSELAAEVRLRWERAADAQRDVALSQRADEQEALQQSLSLHKSRNLASDNEHVGLLLLSHVRWTDSDFHILADRVRMLASLAASRMQSALSAPTVPSQAAVEHLNRAALAISSAETGLSLHGWCKDVCRNRDSLRGSVFRMSKQGQNPVLLLFLVASLNPYNAVFQCLMPVPNRPSSAHSTLADVARDAHLGYLHYFRLCPDFYYFLSQLQLYEETDVDIISESVMLEPQVVVSDADWVPWVHHAVGLPHVASEARHTHATRARKATLNHEVLALHPWLADEAQGIQQLQQQQQRRAQRSSRQNASKRRRLADAEMTEAQLDEAYNVYQDERAEWLEAQSHARSHFESILRGGRWTQSQYGKAVDCIATRAASKEGASFLRTFSLGKMASFSFAKYTRKFATFLASVWVAKCESWHQMYSDGEAVRNLSLEQLPLDSDILSEIRALPQQNAVHKRLVELESWCPRSSPLKIGSVLTHSYFHLQEPWAHWSARIARHVAESLSESRKEAP